MQRLEPDESVHSVSREVDGWGLIGVAEVVGLGLIDVAEVDG